MAILGFHGPRDFLKRALSEQEKNWLDQCDSINPADLLERHRHNLRSGWSSRSRITGG